MTRVQSQVKTICFVSKEDASSPEGCTRFLDPAHLPEETLKEFASLDKNSDGILKVSLDRYDEKDTAQGIDVSGSDISLHQLARLFTKIQSWPFNNRLVDMEHRDARLKNLKELQDSLETSTVSSIWNSLKNEPFTESEIRQILDHFIGSNYKDKGRKKDSEPGPIVNRLDKKDKYLANALLRPLLEIMNHRPLTSEDVRQTIKAFEAKANAPLLQDKKYQAFKREVLGPILSGAENKALSEDQVHVFLQAFRATGDYEALVTYAEYFVNLSQCYPAYSVKRSELLKNAENYLFTALSIASEATEGRQDYLHKINRLLVQKVKPALQKILNHEHAQHIRNPYLLVGSGTPVAAYLDEMAQGKDIYFAVSLPKSFFKKWGVGLNKETGELEKSGKKISLELEEEIKQAIRDYYTDSETVTVRRSSFKNKIYKETYALKPTNIYFDSPRVDDDMYAGAFTYHLQQDRLNHTIFKGEERIYFRVGFAAPELAQELQKEEDRNIWKLDLILRRGSKTLRTVKGGLNFARNHLKQNTDRYSGDPHIHLEDWYTVKKMAEGLIKKRNAGLESDLSVEDRLALQLIDRHYESVNRKFQAFMEQGEDLYRNGRMSRDFMLGDLVDYVNIARTLQQQGYYESNVRQFTWMIEQYDQVVYAVTGNHCYHARKYPKTQSIRHFWHFADEWRKKFLKNADLITFPKTGGNEFDGIQALWTRTIDPEHEHDGEIGFGTLVERLFEEISADDHFELEDDHFLAPTLSSIGPYENYVVGLGNGYRQMMIDTGPEDFQFFLALSKIFQEPVGESVLRGFKLYVDQQHVQGKGPRHEMWPAIIREVRESNERSEWMLMGGHYPPFYKGKGVDGMTDNEDALRYSAALSIRLLMWYYRNETKSTLRAYLGGHVHSYSETTFDISIKPQDEPKFKAQLGEIFRETDGRKYMEKLWSFAYEWDLPSRMDIRRVNDAGTNGFPGPIVQELNSDQLKNPLSLTAFALSGKESGYHLLTTNNHGSGKMSLESSVFHERTSGAMVVMDTSKLPEFEKMRWDEAHDFDPPLMDALMPAYRAPTEPTKETHLDPTDTPSSLWDIFPGFLTNKSVNAKKGIGLEVGGGALLMDHGEGLTLGSDFRMAFQYNHPLDSRLTSDLTHLNFRLGTDLRFDEDELQDLNIYAGMMAVYKHFSFGPTLAVRGLLDDELKAEIGAEIQYSIPSYTLPLVPNPCLLTSVDTDGNYFIGLGLCAQFTLATLRERGPLHPHTIDNNE